MIRRRASMTSAPQQERAIARTNNWDVWEPVAGRLMALVGAVVVVVATVVVGAAVVEGTAVVDVDVVVVVVVVVGEVIATSNTRTCPALLPPPSL